MSSATGVRLTLKFNFYQVLRASGWSESYDLGYADLPTAVAGLTSINAFVFYRLQCAGIGVFLESAVLIGFSQPVTPGAPPARRNTLAIPVPNLPGPDQAYNKSFLNPAANVATYTADFSPTVYYVSLQTSLSGTPVYRRNMWIAGLPDGADQTNTGQITEGQTLAAVTAFLKAVSNSGPGNASNNSVSIRSVDRSNGNPIKQCAAWNLIPNSYTVPGHGFVVNQPVIAEGMKTALGGTCPRGRYLIGSVIDANTITLQRAKPPTAPIKLGGFRAAVMTFNQIAAATGTGFTKRNKGRPSGLSVGRRRTPTTQPA